MGVDKYVDFIMMCLFYIASLFMITALGVKFGLCGGYFDNVLKIVFIGFVIAI